MRIYSVFALVLACVSLHGVAFGQSKNATYRLKGVVNVDTGTVVLLPLGGEEYDPNLKNNYQAKIRQGSFSLEGQMAYPGSYLIIIKPNYVSSDFIIEPGSQTIICNVDSLRETPKLVNKNMEEYRLFMENYIQPTSQQREQAFDQYSAQKSAVTDPFRLDSLQTAYQKRRAELIHQQQLLYLDYTKQHPDSYVALWHLVKDMKEGYRPIFDSVYTALSTSLKNTPTGKVITQRLKSSKMTAIGEIFPTLSLLDIGDKSVSVPTDHKSKYTLIDFWFSHCGPCLSEFPKLKELFISYKDKGFDIVGISIDKKADIKDWKQTIQEKGLVWNHYLDPSGKLTVGVLSINYFPSNFLIDEKGTIIKSNISPGDLGKFLSGKM